MRTFTLKYSIGLLKPAIDDDYFLAIDTMYKAMAFNLAVYSLTVKFIADTTIIDQPIIQQWFQGLGVDAGIPTIPRLSVPPSVILDMGLYLTEFVTARHNSGMLNIYGLSVDDAYNLQITNKQTRIPSVAKNDYDRIAQGTRTRIVLQ